MTKYYDIIISPIVTEKTANAAEDTVYTFKVAKDANKVEIKNAIEKIFNVKVGKVNTINVLPKKHRQGRYVGTKPGYKKAIVSLSSGKIDAFEM